MVSVSAGRDWQTAGLRTDGPGIRPAASLLVVTGGGPYNVLMGRRPRGARFMPGVYVFPGGAVEAGDWSLPVCSDLTAGDMELMCSADASEARALAIAAIRETFEETGLLCCSFGDAGTLSWQEVLAGRRHIDLSRLRYLGRALTPRLSQVRFHARFFYTLYDGDGSRLTESTELEDLRWIDVAAPADLPLAGVTRFMLGELGRRLNGPNSVRAAPFWYRESGEYHVAFDHAGSSGEE